jgi:hypothetical protein
MNASRSALMALPSGTGAEHPPRRAFRLWCQRRPETHSPTSASLVLVGRPERERRDPGELRRARPARLSRLIPLPERPPRSQGFDATELWSTRVHPGRESRCRLGVATCQPCPPARPRRRDPGRRSCRAPCSRCACARLCSTSASAPPRQGRLIPLSSGASVRRTVRRRAALGSTSTSGLDLPRRRAGYIASSRRPSRPCTPPRRWSWRIGCRTPLANGQ